MGLKDILIKKLTALMKGLLEKYSAFIKKPASLIAVSVAANVILNKLLDWLKSLLQNSIQAALAAGYDKLLVLIFADGQVTDDQIQDYVNRHPGLQNVLNFAGNDLNERVVGDIILACTDTEYYNAILNDLVSNLAISDKSLEGNDFMQIIGNASDFDDKISEYDNRSGFDSLIDPAECDCIV